MFIDVVGDDVDLGVGFAYYVDKSSGDRDKLLKSRERGLKTAQQRFFNFIYWLVTQFRTYKINLNCYLVSGKTAVEAEDVLDESETLLFNKRLSHVRYEHAS